MADDEPVSFFRELAERARKHIESRTAAARAELTAELRGHASATASRFDALERRLSEAEAELRALKSARRGSKP